jgi:hypothetical protein
MIAKKQRQIRFCLIQSIGSTTPGCPGANNAQKGVTVQTDLKGDNTFILGVRSDTMSAVVLDALVGPHPVYGVGLNFGAVLQLKTACQNALGASSKEIEDGAQKYAAWGSSPEAGGSKR